jgi:hypothetical protein
MLETQLQQLIDRGINYAVPRQVMERAVIPILKKYATKFAKEEYYIPVSHSGNWLITVLESKQMPIRQKKVLYAFANSKMAPKILNSSPEKLQLIPVTYLLFEIFALQDLDSVIFIDSLSSLKHTEIERLVLCQEIQNSLTEISPPSTYC